MNKTILQEYAKLIARCGVNVQKGQEVLINCGLDQPEFVAMVVEEAYKAGAGKVTVNWNYQPLTRLHAEYQEIESLGAVYEWEKAKLQHYVDTVPCRIHLISDDPDGLDMRAHIQVPRGAEAQAELSDCRNQCIAMSSWTTSVILSNAKDLAQGLCQTRLRDSSDASLCQNDTKVENLNNNSEITNHNSELSSCTIPYT